MTKANGELAEVYFTVERRFGVTCFRYADLTERDQVRLSPKIAF